MSDNLIPFPKLKKSDKGSTHQAPVSSELIELRAAFDRARETWPIELAELPENNKIYYYKK